MNSTLDSKIQTLAFRLHFLEHCPITKSVVCYSNRWTEFSKCYFKALCSNAWDINCEVFMGGSTDSGVFKWEYSNTLLNYSNWYPNEPSDTGTRECIFLMYNGQWSDGKCVYHRKFVCEKVK